jgi:hypothetical protein
VHDLPFAAETITFKHSFHIEGIERLLPAGAYQVIVDEETIEVKPSRPGAASARRSSYPMSVHASVGND